ncbi:hypothetical protein SEA_KNOCKER_74 [Mycobacterium phage Knocker]|nr:hypothetical protein SEA_KNOCKER_74 [Mycobacterium phage Knocker]
MALTRDQRRQMERSLARMKHRREAKAARPATPVPVVAAPDADGVTIVDPPAPAAPSRKAVEHVAGRMWWAAQSPGIADDQRDRLLSARDTVLKESALA